MSVGQVNTRFGIIYTGEMPARRGLSGFGVDGVDKRKEKRNHGTTGLWARQIGPAPPSPLCVPRIYTIYTGAPKCPSIKGSDGVGHRKANVHGACTGMRILTANN